MIFVLMIRRPPGATRTDTLFPYTTLFRSLEVAAQTDLTQYLQTEARNLTVGGMKRLEIARALAIRPSILLLDEVMAGLNPADLEKAVKMLRRIRESGGSILLIEHLMQATMALSDRIIVRSEERRAGQEGVRECRSRCSPYH